MSNIKNSNEPVKKVEDSTAEHSNPKENNGEPATGVGTSVNVSPTPKCQCHTAEKEKNPRKWWEIVLAYLPLLISAGALAVSFGSCNASWQSATAAQRSAGATEQSAIANQQNVATAKAALDAAIERDRRDQRAWIGMRDTRLVNPVQAGQPITISTQLQNTGKTPALDVRIPLKRGIVEPPNLASFEVPADDRLQSQVYLVSPTESQTALFRISGVHVTEEVAAAVNEGKAPLYLYGVLTYKDVFDHSRRTRVCVMFRNIRMYPMPAELCDKEGYNHME
jgi:hypothetical protein